MTRKNRGLISLMCVSVLMGCSMEPEFKRPETKVARTFVFKNQDLVAASGNVTVKWWERLEDETLNAYVTILLRDNLSLRESFQRIVQARQQVKMDQGGFFPSVSLGVDGSRSFQPVNSFAIPGAGGGNRRFFANSYGADVSAAWEIDLFGRIASGVKASKAQLEASEFDTYALEQSLIGQLVKLRVASVVSYHALQTAKESADNYEKIYTLTQRRYKLGVKDVSLLDVHEADKNLHASKATVHGLERQLVQNLYALDVLLGKAPGTTVLDDSNATLPTLPRASVTCLPIALLDRRPDLKASELRLKAQNAGIGVAMADLYPNLSISSTLGYSSMKSSRFIASDQLAGSLLASVTGKLFQGGRLRANVKLQEARAKEMALSYSNQVLEALKEVELALKFDGELKRELLHMQASLDMLERKQDNYNNRYRLGIGDLKTLLQSKQSTYQAKQEWLSMVQARFDGRVNLYLSLGGDWLGETGSKALGNKCLLARINK